MTLINCYATVADIRDHLNDVSSKLDTDLVERAINAASRAIDMYCSGSQPGWRRFWLDAGVTTRIFQVDDPGLAWVDDIGSTTGLIIKTDDDADGVYETTWTLGTDCHLEPLNVNVAAAGDTVTPWAFWRIAAIDLQNGGKTFLRYQRRAVLQVTARFGWSGIPSEVSLATVLLSVKLFKRKDAPFGISGMSDFGALRIAQQDPDVKALLQPYIKERPRALVFNAQRNSLFHTRLT